MHRPRPAHAALARSLAFAGLLLVATTGLRALDWDGRTEEVGAYEGEAEAKALFHYHNPGHRTVTITSVDASCGCTDAAVEKKVVGPGESGTLTATMTIGTRVGRQEKWITVTTDEDQGAPVTLTLVVTIKETAVCEPRLLMWAKGDAPAPKSTDIVAAEGETIDAVEVACDSKSVSAGVVPVEAGRRFRVTATPLSTSANGVAEIVCTVHVRGRPVLALRIYASVH